MNPKDPPIELVLQNAHQELEAIKAKLEPFSWAEIPTSKGLYALVDNSHAVEIGKYSWWAEIAGGGHIYARTDIDGKRVAMQRLVYCLENPGAEIETVKNVSFANKCSLDCRYYNLRDRPDRVAAMRNRKKRRGSSSEYKGVRKKHRKDGEARFSVSIGAKKGSVIYLGQFVSERFAAEVYDAAAIMLFEGADHPNFPESSPSTEAIQEAANGISRWKASL